jgi:hypothetical protein
MTGDNSDQAFVRQALAHLPPTSPSPRFEAALLAAYDAWKVEREKGVWAAWKAGLNCFSEIVWPGAPSWAPASALAAALLAGASLGSLFPAAANTEPLGFSLEQPESFSLISSDLPQEEPDDRS